MGDQIGVAVSGNLYYVPHNEFKKVLLADLDTVSKAKIFSSFCRINTLYMIACAGSGHGGSSFSSLDIMSWIYLNEIPNKKNSLQNNNLFFSSKGHDAPGLYSVLIGLDMLDFNLIHSLRRINGVPGHPDVKTPNINTNTGSLGMGISKAKGMVKANKLSNKHGNVFVLTGDGELQEGQFWESLPSAVNHNLNEIIVIVDHNKLQSDTLVSKVSDLGDIEAKFKSFGWYVCRCDGNNLDDFSDTLNKVKQVVNKPKVIIADTIKGKGVSFMEHTSIDSDVELYKYHSGAPTSDSYIEASQELIDSSNAYLKKYGLERLELEQLIRPKAIESQGDEKLIHAYGQALTEQAKANKKIVALDADLVLDTGLIPFQEKFPDRFIECGIAEQDMVSQAGGMALKGLLPIVHSFSCFLTARSNEQIYNNSTENTKIIYVGSLSGLIPGGPGHSHQGVRDISSMAAMPNMTIIEPSCETEVSSILDWAINQNDYSSYIRLVSLPTKINFKYPEDKALKKGCGIEIKPGKDSYIFAYGPKMLSLAIEASDSIKEDCAIDIGVINMPWLNYIDKEWFIKLVDSKSIIFSIDNHYRIGALGDRISAIVASSSELKTCVHTIALDEIPSCGTNEEILEKHGFSYTQIRDYILHKLNQ